VHPSSVKHSNLPESLSQRYPIFSTHETSMEPSFHSKHIANPREKLKIITQDARFSVQDLSTYSKDSKPFFSISPNESYTNPTFSQYYNMPISSFNLPSNSQYPNYPTWGASFMHPGNTPTTNGGMFNNTPRGIEFMFHHPYNWQGFLQSPIGFNSFTDYPLNLSSNQSSYQRIIDLGTSIPQYMNIDERFHNHESISEHIYHSQIDSNIKNNIDSNEFKEISNNRKRIFSSSSHHSSDQSHIIHTTSSSTSKSSDSELSLSPKRSKIHISNQIKSPMVLSLNPIHRHDLYTDIPRRKIYDDDERNEDEEKEEGNKEIKEVIAARHHPDPQIITTIESNQEKIVEYDNKTLSINSNQSN